MKSLTGSVGLWTQRPYGVAREHELGGQRNQTDSCAHLSQIYGSGYRNIQCFIQRFLVRTEPQHSHTRKPLNHDERNVRKNEKKMG